MWRGRVAGFLASLLLCAAPAWAGGPNFAGNPGSVTGPLTLNETLGPELLTQTCAGWGLTTPVGASSCEGTTITRTASASNLTITNGASISEGATGTYYLWTVVTNLTASTVTPSFCGQSLTAISTTGALTTYYRLFCPYQAAALAAPVLTFTATTAGTIDVSGTKLEPITSVQSGTGLAFKAGAGGYHVVLGATYAEIWQGADSKGWRVYGYDDRYASYIENFVDANGTPTLKFSGGALSLIGAGAAGFKFYPGGVGDISIVADADSLFQIGDDSYSWGHSPMFGLEGVGEYDSKQWFDAGMNITGAVTVSGTAPGLTSCGNSPTITSGSTDHAGVFVIGATGTGCTLTFAADQGADTVCVVGGAAAATWASTDTALVVTAVPGEYSYVCYGL